MNIKTIAISSITVASSIAILILAMLVGSSDWQQLWTSELQQQIFWQIRLPRVLLALCVGCALAISGTLIQAVIRNPLADPGLIGVSGGAALGAALALFCMSVFSISFSWLVVAGAFAGGLLATILVMSIGRRQQHNVSLIILAGIAINFLSGALIGLVIYLVPDQTLRQINFWTLGSLSSANYSEVLVVAVVLFAVAMWSLLQHRTLDALLLGESEARSLGVDVERFKQQLIVIVALVVAVCVSIVGTIGFIGLVTPHIGRLLFGAQHKILLPVTLLLGGVLLVAADLISRTVISPAELPIGIVTALIGAPVFIGLLIREGRR